MTEKQTEKQTDWRGEFVWHELMTTDVEAAKAFYCETIGWSTEFSKNAGRPYTMWTAAGAGVGGLMAMPEEVRKMGAPPHWMGYVGTSDLEGSLAKIKSLGGSVRMPPTVIPTVGRFAVFADPQGVVLALFTPDKGGREVGAMGPGHISWNELATRDPATAWTFYSSMFGWNKTGAMDMGPGNTYQMFGRGERAYGGMMAMPPAMESPPAWLYYITVADLDGALGQVKRRGGRVLSGPTALPDGGRVAQCLDPQGAAFALHAQ